MIATEPNIFSKNQIILTTLLCFWAVDAIVPGWAAAFVTWFAVGAMTDYGNLHYYDNWTTDVEIRRKRGVFHLDF